MFKNGYLELHFQFSKNKHLKHEQGGGCSRATGVDRQELEGGSALTKPSQGLDQGQRFTPPLTRRMHFVT